MRKELVKFVVKGLPPTENHALSQARNGRRYPSKEYLQWKDEVAKHEIQKIVDSEWYEVDATYYFPLYFKNGNRRKKDLRNLNKYTDDELCKRLITYSGNTVDDSQIIDGAEHKQDCKEGEERTEWIIWAVG